MRGGQKPAGVASRRTTAFLINRARLSWYMTFTLCPSLSSCLRHKCCSQRRGRHLVTMRMEGTCSGTVVEQGLGFLTINSSSSCTSLGLLLVWTSCHMREIKPYLAKPLCLGVFELYRYLPHKVAVKTKMGQG